MKNKKNKRKDNMTKEKATLEMVIRWLDSNIDDAMNEFDPLASDSADLKQKIELALEPETTIEQIENSNL